MITIHFKADVVIQYTTHYTLNVLQSPRCAAHSAQCVSDYTKGVATARQLSVHDSPPGSEKRGETETRR